ncbi:Aspartate carbamoyltransferase regulatory chain [Bienertia sinuspersici]
MEERRWQCFWGRWWSEIVVGGRWFWMVGASMVVRFGSGSRVVVVEVARKEVDDGGGSVGDGVLEISGGDGGGRCISSSVSPSKLPSTSVIKSNPEIKSEDKDRLGHPSPKAAEVLRMSRPMLLVFLLLILIITSQFEWRQQLVTDVESNHSVSQKQQRISKREEAVKEKVI